MKKWEERFEELTTSPKDWIPCKKCGMHFPSLNKNGLCGLCQWEEDHKLRKDKITYWL